MKLKQKILQSLSKILGTHDFKLDIPEREEFGDYSSNIAMVMFAKQKSENKIQKTKNTDTKGMEDAHTSEVDIAEEMGSHSGEPKATPESGSGHPEDWKDEGSPSQHTTNIQYTNFSSPRQLAEHIVDELNKDKELAKVVSKIEVAGAGFINFTLSTDALLNNMMQIDTDESKRVKGQESKRKEVNPPGRRPSRVGDKKQKTISNEQKAERHLLGEIRPVIPAITPVIPAQAGIYTNNVYGSSNLYKGKKYAVEFAHPNTHKAFHIGHLRNIITGESLSRILSSAGADIKRVNYQGDVGLHIAKAIWGIKKLGLPDTEDILERASFLGKAYTEGSSAYEEGDSKKEEIHKINESLYKGEDTNLMELYKKTRQWSLDYFDYIYKRVDSKFDRFYFESEVADEGLRLAKEALEKKILIESEGAVIFPGQKAGLHDRVFITSRGVPTYEGKDLGLAKLQFSELHPDLIIHVVGPEQADYFKVVFRALERIVPESKGKEVHIPYGWVKLKDGKMSSRSGNVVLGNWLLDEAKKKIREKYKSDSDTAEKIAVGAVKYSFLRNSLSQEIAFDLEESVALEGNSGPYLQYTYARTQSVLRKGERVKMPFGSAAQDKQESKKKNERGKYVITSGSSVIASEAKQSQPFNKEELFLMKSLFHFPEIVESAAQSYAPNIICNYLYDLAQKFNTFYNKHRIINEIFPEVLAEDNLGMDCHSDPEPADGEESHVYTERSRSVIASETKQSVSLRQSGEPKATPESYNSETEEFRLLLTSSVGTVLKSGLNLLGIQSPERM